MSKQFFALSFDLKTHTNTIIKLKLNVLFSHLLVSSGSNLGTFTHGWCGASTRSGGGSLESFDTRLPAWLSFTLKPPPHSCWFNLFPVLDRQPLMIISPNLVILISSICGNSYVTWSGIESLSPSLSVIPIRDTCGLPIRPRSYYSSSINYSARWNVKIWL